MKQVVIIAVILALFSPTVVAQRLRPGERPQVQTFYPEGAEPVEGRPLMLEFFLSGGPQSERRKTLLDSLAKVYHGVMDVVLVAREQSTLDTLLSSSDRYAFIVGADPHGETFRNFRVQYVPYGVILDSRGRVAWHGNPVKLTHQMITDVLRQ